jgi:hypothetical protein
MPASQTPSRLVGGAAEALGTIAAFLVGGLGLATLERAAPPAPDVYARQAMAPALWLVDGFNVLCAGLLGGRDRISFWTEAGRRAVLDRAARFDAPDARVVVVFDGPRPASAPAAGSRLETVFAPSADAWILDALRESGIAPVVVVTADRRLAGRARQRGAEVVAPLAFLARCPGETC